MPLFQFKCFFMRVILLGSGQDGNKKVTSWWRRDTNTAYVAAKAVSCSNTSFPVSAYTSLRRSIFCGPEFDTISWIATYIASEKRVLLWSIYWELEWAYRIILRGVVSDACGLYNVLITAHGLLMIFFFVMFRVHSKNRPVKRNATYIKISGPSLFTYSFIWPSHMRKSQITQKQ